MVFPGKYRPWVSPGSVREKPPHILHQPPGAQTLKALGIGQRFHPHRDVQMIASRIHQSLCLFPLPVVPLRNLRKFSVSAGELFP